MSSGYRSEAPRWVGIALFVTLLPDLDFILPWFAHRGITHSLLAGVCLGGFVALAVAAIRWGRIGVSSEEYVRQIVLGFMVGTGSVVSHLVGDCITPMGIRPFFPVDTVYTLNLVSATNLRANLAFIVVGTVVFWTVYGRSKDPVPTDGATSGGLPAESDIHSSGP